ncbi:MULTISPECIES: NAD-dependent epimerase/dehydratase family protein [Paenibacillus]|uniref:NAD-dependent epimerase/dehydratase family protein n=1 Tax=Paenibacillus TaxID=44249 RepID=UPI000737C677|nr:MULTISPECIES: NAD-dependent epimerase/dehydratase family protein [Paenibacillus]KAF6567417.1 NAD-dependent epimerase/dehydratase family protein [Paenibacillus sp. EKM202P]KAF6573469.1 NAD-dependent epimerase/dehydratase family protein [Paenibacillus sp. EKM207P]KAF6587386.1 NAD-dependent epimerase/dehydratase family protein [Paenibacillus sp. EKM211P]
MKVIVTGGAGFIGSNIVDLLVKHNHKVAIIDNLSTGKRENINSFAEFFEADIRDTNSLDYIFSNVEPEIVIHHAAQISVQESFRDPYLDAQININGTINILNQCVSHNVRKIIYASSAAVYGVPQYVSINEQHPVSPISFYGISKYAPEEYIKLYSVSYGLKHTILRYANVYGIRQDPKGEGGVISIFLNQLLQKHVPVIYGSGEQTRDFVYVKDIALANLAALTTAHNEVLNISTDREVTINELYNIIASLLESSIRPEYRNERTGDILRSALTNQKAAELLNWIPRHTLEEGLALTLDYYQKELSNGGKN